ncbi:MAG: hypothetical protein R3224_09775 [Balneolaceae bacterium]|nr:hypothetical protein [Balneolaceae bacterium]
MSGYTVSKCICHDRRFEEIQEYARENGYTKFEELKQDRFCGCSCGMCEPYVEMMLKTGKTEFRPGEYYRKSS